MIHKKKIHRGTIEDYLFLVFSICEEKGLFLIIDSLLLTEETKDLLLLFLFS